MCCAAPGTNHTELLTGGVSESPAPCSPLAAAARSQSDEWLSKQKIGLKCCTGEASCSRAKQSNPCRHCAARLYAQYRWAEQAQCPRNYARSGAQAGVEEADKQKEVDVALAWPDCYFVPPLDPHCDDMPTRCGDNTRKHLSRALGLCVPLLQHLQPAQCAVRLPSPAWSVTSPLCPRWAVHAWWVTCSCRGCSVSQSQAPSAHGQQRRAPSRL